MITRADLKWWLDLESELDWRFATTYAEGAPHEYVAAPRTQGMDERDYVRAAHVIQTFGEPMKFFKQTRIYLTTPMGWKHWTMHRDLDETSLVNRGRVEHVYGAQNMPRTTSDHESTYDAYASAWDTTYAMTESEKAETAGLIGSTFGCRLGRTLDIGCGTGWPVTAGIADPLHYVGVDPSTPMLNALVAKHPILAGLHPMTWREAEQRQVLCGARFETVLALGGSASHLDPSDIRAAQARTRRAVLLMHYALGEGPITDTLDPMATAKSLAAATEVATRQTRIGRFVASVVPSSTTDHGVR